MDKKDTTLSIDEVRNKLATNNNYKDYCYQLSNDNFCYVLYFLNQFYKDINLNKLTPSEILELTSTLTQVYRLLKMLDNFFEVYINTKGKKYE